MVKNRYGFHFGSGVFDSIKSRKLLGLGSIDIDPDDRKRYSNSISMFFNKVSYEDIQLLKDNEFEPWNNDLLYLYKVDLLKNKKAIKEISFYSTPEEIEFSNKHWNEYTGNAKDIKEFLKQKKKYMEHLKREMKDCKCARVPMTVEEFAQHDRVDEYKQTHKYVLINLQCGSKSQYASCIPHMQAWIEKPLEWETVECYNFKEGYKIVELNPDNFKEYSGRYISTYTGQFKASLKEVDLEQMICESKILIIEKDDGGFGFLRYYDKGVDKDFNKFSKTKEYIMLIGLAAEKSGYKAGSILTNYLKKIADIKRASIIAVVWKDDLIPYYKQLGFEIVKPKSKKYPSTLAVYTPV